MNRKLQHTVMALSATATVFTMLLLAGGPPSPAALPQPGQGLMLSAGMADDGDAAAIDGTAVDTGTDADSGRRNHLRRTRAALALPYFSFAQGLRGFGS